MKIKTIISLIAFVAAFGFSSFLSIMVAQKDASLIDESFIKVIDNNSERQTHSTRLAGEKVLAFLQQDDRNGNAKEEDMLYDDDSPFSNRAVAQSAKAVSAYVKKSGNMKTFGLPADFQIAWRKHINAWRDYAEFLDQAKTMKLNKDRFFQLDAEYNDEINNTWEDVLQVSENYNANIRFEISVAD